MNPNFRIGSSHGYEPTALHNARGNSVISVLIEHGAKIREIEPKTGRTVFEWKLFNAIYDPEEEKTLELFILPEYFKNSGQKPLNSQELVDSFDKIYKYSTTCPGERDKLKKIKEKLIVQDHPVLQIIKQIANSCLR